MTQDKQEQLFFDLLGQTELSKAQSDLFDSLLQKAGSQSSDTDLVWSPEECKIFYHTPFTGDWQQYTEQFDNKS